jgi:hypothetical protein
LDRSENGRDSFAKLAYLRMLQTSSLDIYTYEALLIYHHYQATGVSRSLWQAHSTGEIQFEFVPGDHKNWESIILNTIPLIRHQFETLDDRKQVAVENEGASGAVPAFESPGRATYKNDTCEQPIE